MKNLLVIDGNSIMNRQFYGIRPLTTKSGVFTNAVYGFVNVLLLTLERLKPDYAAVAFDLKAPTFRHKMYPEYKAGRHATPPELLMQFPYVKDVIRAMGITVIEKEGFEADDVLGTLSSMALAEGDTFAYILTGDRDSLQLISERATVLLATNTQTVDFTVDVFIEKYGVHPSQFVDVKALMGDSSDNIPGVRGIGEKTALKLISECSSLDGLYGSLDSIKLGAKARENLLTDRESAFLSRELARIVTDAPLGITDLEQIRIADRDDPSLLSLFTELEFSSFIKRLSLDSVAKKDELPIQTVDIAFINAIKQGKNVAMILKEREIELCSEGLCVRAEFDELSSLSPFFENNSLIVHDCKSLFHRLFSCGVEKVNVAFDVMLAAYVISPADASYELTRLCSAYVGTPSESASSLLTLADALYAKLGQDRLESLYFDIEQPLALVLFEMERTGFAVDKEGLADFSDMLGRKIDSHLEQIYSLAGHPFNVNSTKQLAAVLFEELKLPAFKKTKSGFSTDAEVLEKLRPYHEIIDLILAYRQFAKLKSTYADGLLAVADERMRVHSCFNQTVTATGRLSSTEPNLQNIPIRTPLGHEMRKCFVAKEGYTLVDADYSQIELRLLAHISADPAMCEAFKNGEDIHASTAARVFNVPLEQVTSEQRKRAKAINFGIVYGMGGYTLASDLGISKKEADEYIANYKSKFSGVSEYLSAIIESAYRNGYVTTMFGRRRYIPELTSGKAMLKNFGERVAMNSPIQGSAADIIKIAMVNVSRALKESGIDARLVLQVHDELIIEASDADAPRAAEILREQMESAAPISVPLTAEVSMGKTWFDCK